MRQRRTCQGRSHGLGFLEPRAAVPQAKGPALPESCSDDILRARRSPGGLQRAYRALGPFSKRSPSPKLREPRRYLDS